MPQIRQIFEELGFTVAEVSFTCRCSMGPWHGGHPDAKDLADLKAFTEKVVNGK
ncbi:MAG: hypothetical protein J5902_01770 [Paludibacteraceae bacterium]|nr:hypothetical protein [Paludibacteraceae bacterium]